MTEKLATSVTHAAGVDLTDVNNSRTIAVLATRPFSRVLDVGAGGGQTIRSLHDRGCAVWAIDKDAKLTAAIEQWCQRVWTIDIEAVDLGAVLEGQAFDVILLLDVLEHLREPARVLLQLSRHLAPGGRVILSVPNVGHAAVRLQLLSGHFVRTDTGLLDRTHLQFFDRDGLRALLSESRLQVLDEIRIVRAPSETEIPIDLDAYPPETLRLATQGADALTYQYVVIASPGESRPSAAAPALAGVLKEKLIALSEQYRALEKWALKMEGELRQQTPPSRLSEEQLAIAERLTTHEAHLQDIAEQLRAERDRDDARFTSIRDHFEHYAGLAAGLDRLHSELATTRRELDAARSELGYLHQDLEIKESYLSALREADSSRAAHAQSLEQQLDASRRQLHELREAGANKEAHVHSLEQQLEAGRRQLHELQESSASKDAHSQRLEQQLDGAKRQLNELRESSASIIAFGRSLEQQLDAGGRELHELQDARARLEVQVRAGDERVAILQGRLAQSESLVAASATALAASRDEVQGYQRTLQLPRYRLINATNRIARMTGPLHRMVKRLSMWVFRGD